MSAITSTKQGEQRRVPIARQIPVDPPEPLWRILAGGPVSVVLLGVAGLIVAITLDPPRAGLIAASSIGLVAVGVLYGRSAVKRIRRLELTNLLVGRLGPVTGHVQLKPARWMGRGAGYPRRVRISYGPGAAAGDPFFEASVVGVLEDVLGAHYVVHKHRIKLAQLQLRAAPVEVEEKAPDTRPTDQVRAEALLETMIPGRRIDHVEVVDGTVTRIEGSHDLGAKLAAEGYQRRVENTFSRCMPGRWRCRWDTIGDTFTFELRPTFPDLVRLPPLPRVDVDPVDSYKEIFFAIGVDEDGEPVGWRPRHQPQGVVVGATGTGKTVVLRSLAQLAAHAGWTVFVLDGKGVEFLGLRSWPNVALVANRVEEQVALLSRVHAIMEERYALVEQGQASTDDFEPILFLVDEFADFRANLMTWYSANKPKGAPTRPLVLEALWSILRKGRTARVHAVIGLQRPDQQYFEGDARDNLNFRVSLSRLKIDGARMMWESPSIGTTIPRGKQGRGTCVNRHGQPVEMQAFFNPDPWDLKPGDPELAELDQYRPVTTRHQRMVIIPPEPLVDLDGEGKDIPPDYWDYLEADWGWASDHPDLDPVQVAASASRSSGRSQSSAASILGLSTNDSPAATAAPAAPSTSDDADGQETGTTEVSLDKDTSTPPVEEQPRDEGGNDGARPALRVVPSTSSEEGEDEDFVELDLEVDDFFDGYKEPHWAAPQDVQIGWLVRLESDEAWAVVEDIGPDPTDTNSWAIAWRDDDDQDGMTGVPEDELVRVCEPEEEHDAD